MAPVSTRDTIRVTALLLLPYLCACAHVNARFLGKFNNLITQKLSAVQTSSPPALLRRRSAAGISSNPRRASAKVSDSFVETQGLKYREDVSKDGIHLHFGAGKLGCGLLLEALEVSSSDYAVVQRPSRAFKKLLAEDVEKVSVKVNGETVVDSIKILSGDEVASAVPGSGPYFLLANNDQEDILNLALKASTFSCSLNKGIPELKSLLWKLPSRSNPPKLFACENDHDAVRELAQDLRGKVTIVPCMIDRICSKRDIQDGTISIEAEPWKGQIVVLPALKVEDKEDSVRHNPLDLLWDFSLTPSSGKAASNSEEIPFDGPTVTETENDEQAKFFAERKLLLVNGAHTTLAFLTLARKLESLRGDVSRMPLPGKLPLLNYDTADEASRKQAWAWTVARCFILANEFSASSLLSAHSADTEEAALRSLLDYGWSTLQRFSHVPDTTDRVLSGGVVERYNGRLRNVEKKLANLKWSPRVPLADILAASSGEGRPFLSETDVYQAIDSLVRAAAPIAREKSLRDRQVSREQTQTKVVSVKKTLRNVWFEKSRKAERTVPAMESRRTLAGFHRSVSCRGTGAA